VDKAYNLTDLQRQAEKNRPMFEAFDALIDQYKAQRKLAMLNYKPDFTLWGGYRWRDNGLPDGGTDFVSAGISVNLPIHRARLDAAVAEADSALRMAHQKRNDFRNKVDLTIHRAMTKFDQAGQLVKLYKSGIIPQAEQTYQATLSAYQVDKVDFLNLLDAVMSLYRYDIDYARAISDQQRSRAQLEAAAGIGLYASAQDHDSTSDRMKP
jgi:cobalt-zinc-cadmium efflux system outer membrane protein